MEGGQRYEILKIWVPTHGAVNVYRSPQGGTETVLETYSIARKIIAFTSFSCSFFFLVYHVDNGCLLEQGRNEYGIEKIRILASHGSVIVITRDNQLTGVQNKYKIEPPTLTMDASSVNVMNN